MKRWLWLVMLVGLFGCGPEAPPELDPVFVIMCGDVDPEEPPHPCCTGFALGNEVVTANHCVAGETAVLVSNRQWLDTSNDFQIGNVLRREPALDIAWLSAKLDGPGLRQGGPVTRGDQVRALTRSGVWLGTANERTGIFWLSSLDTDLGDSGSAIIDGAGFAVGVLTDCLTMTGRECDPQTGIFTELP
jgi:hypothetical protein